MWHCDAGSRSVPVVRVVVAPSPAPPAAKKGNKAGGAAAPGPVLERLPGAGAKTGKASSLAAATTTSASSGSSMVVSDPAPVLAPAVAKPPAAKKIKAGSASGEAPAPAPVKRSKFLGPAASPGMHTVQ